MYESICAGKVATERAKLLQRQRFVRRPLPRRLPNDVHADVSNGDSPGSALPRSAQRQLWGTIKERGTLAG